MFARVGGGKVVAKAHPCNAPGDFYVEDGCCITCGVPHMVAPDLFGWTDDESHCFVRRQPASPEEVDSAVHALWSAEASCIRYRGTDRALLNRIAEMGEADQCDLHPGPVAVRIRDRVTFASGAGDGDSPLALADRFRAHLATDDRPHPYKVRPRRPWRPARAIFSWDVLPGRRGHFHSVDFTVSRRKSDRFEARLTGWRPAANGLGLMFDKWLKTVEGATDIRWFSIDEYDRGGDGFHMPI
jgi:hypothetical protein